MKTITYIFITLMLIIMTSATTVSIMTVKPAQPVDTAVIVGNPETLKSAINSHCKRGYIVKCVVPGAMSNHRQYNGMAILEKY